MRWAIQPARRECLPVEDPVAADLAPDKLHVVEVDAIGRAGRIARVHQGERGLTGRVGSEDVLEAIVDELLDRLRRAEVLGELQHLTHAGELLLGRGIGLEIGTAEAIDALLRIADDEEGAGPWGDRAPVAALGRVGGEEEADLGLNRVGVLELIDQEALVLATQRTSWRRLMCAGDSRQG